MSRNQNVSVFLLTLAFIFTFLGAFINLPFAAYLSSLFYILSLFLYKKISPILFFSMGLICFFIFILSPSAYIAAALFPLMGFLFSGKNKSASCDKCWSRYLLWSAVALMYLILITQDTSSSVASTNYLSVIITYAILAEILYFSNISKLYIPLIFVSFLFFGNRSAIFLVAAYIKNRAALLSFVLIAALFTSFANGFIKSPEFLDFLFKDGGLLYRSYRETRNDYVDEFIIRFNLNELHYDNFDSVYFPLISDGFYDLHNSFLTIIARDYYLGLFKDILWAFQILVIPIGVFVGVSLRAAHDTFLLGGVNDIILYALFGRSIKDVGHIMVKFFNANLKLRQR